jgi:ABC-2 type transport system ATP-binding protein
VKDLREEHTILLSTHILPEVAQICQRVLIINKGRIVATDTPANLTRRLQKSSQVVVQVRDRSSDLAEALQRLDGVETVAAAEDGKNRLVVETDQSRDLRSDIARLVIEMGIDLLELKLMDMSLEDIFMQLVTKEPGQSEEEASR